MIILQVAVFVITAAAVSTICWMFYKLIREDKDETS